MQRCESSLEGGGSLRSGLWGLIGRGIKANLPPTKVPGLSVCHLAFAALTLKRHYLAWYASLCEERSKQGLEKVAPCEAWISRSGKGLSEIVRHKVSVIFCSEDDSEPIYIP